MGKTICDIRYDVSARGGNKEVDVSLHYGKDGYTFRAYWHSLSVEPGPAPTTSHDEEVAPGTGAS